jgi:hypothetical protein
MSERSFTQIGKAYKEAFVDFIKTKQWHWFITIPIGECGDDDLILKRLRRIENELCRRYLVNRYYKLPAHARYSFAIAFEGQRQCGTRHAHILAHIPSPTKSRLSQMLEEVASRIDNRELPYLRDPNSRRSSNVSTFRLICHAAFAPTQTIFTNFACASLSASMYLLVVVRLACPANA